MKKKLILKILAVGTISITLLLGIGVTNRVFAEDVILNTATAESAEKEKNTATNATSNTVDVKTEKKDITKLKNKINTSIHTYTGEKRTPSVKIYDGNNTLKEGQDYTVKYKNNKNPGKATITVKGKGNYKGTIIKYFYIAPQKEKIKSVIFSSTFTKATIKWEKDNKADGYIIYMSETKDGEYTKIKTIKNKKTTEYTKKGLDPDKIYYFKIRGYKNVDGKKICKFYSSAKSNTGLLAKVELTSYSSGSNRNHNLSLASKKINGLVLKPGQTFNWFQVVGPASKARGYKQASVFVNGKTVLGYGGGVCQVSTTLYQASLKAGLKIIERHMHSKAVTYTTRGKDATVSYGVQNLRIRNNKNYSIKIVTTSNKGTTKCELYRIAD